MLAKASAASASLDLTLTGSVRYMLECVISESDLNTVLADLIENALTAVKNSAVKKVLVSIGAADNAYFISVFDSGEPFLPEVLESIGKKRITTRAGEGGSGIGLMTLHEIISAHRPALLSTNLPTTAQATKNASAFVSTGKEGWKSRPRA
jgi:sensor histidine kinase regulating citrate/malate metabolism